MADVRPFRGIRYKDCSGLASLICPPYDVINPRQEQELRNGNPYNFINIEYPQPMAGDNDTQDKYTRALKYFQKWIDNDIFTQDRQSMYYLHEHTFNYRGKEFKRVELFARVRLKEWNKMIIRPHERTLSGPKRDRINLINTLKINTSPIYCLYNDSDKRLSDLICGLTDTTTDIEFDADAGEHHRIRLIDDPKVNSMIQEAFQSKYLYIADGHHRYESALSYRDDWRALNPGYSGDAAANYTLMALTDMSDAGLLILPTHRLVKGVHYSKLQGFENKLNEYFDIRRVSTDYCGSGSDINTLLDAHSSDFMIYGLNTGEALILRERNREQIEGLMPDGHTNAYNRMDTSIVDHVILEHILEMDTMSEEHIAFEHDLDSACRRVDSGEFQFAFILKPVLPETIKEISDSQDRMPRKSTYFYPKIPSGMVIHSLNS